jgi:hypothetical protein
MYGFKVVRRRWWYTRCFDLPRTYCRACSRVDSEKVIARVAELVITGFVVPLQGSDQKHANMSWLANELGKLDRHGVQDCRKRDDDQRAANHFRERSHDFSPVEYVNNTATSLCGKS